MIHAEVASHAPISTSPFPVWLTVGLVCGITVVVLLLLFLGRYAKSKGDLFPQLAPKQQQKRLTHLKAEQFSFLQRCALPGWEQHFFLNRAA